MDRLKQVLISMLHDGLTDSTTKYEIQNGLEEVNGDKYDVEITSIDNATWMIRIKLPNSPSRMFRLKLSEMM